MSATGPESVPAAVASEDVTPEARDAASRPYWKRDISLFLGGQTISLFGSMLVQYAVMWHLTLESKSGVIMMLSVLFGFLPQAVVSIFGGVWADRLNRKMLIILADGTIALTTLGLALILLTGYYDYWLIFLTLAIRSAGAGIQTPAVSALIPQLTPTEHLIRVNGINQSIQSGMMLLAPAAAGALYAAFDLVAIFFVDVVTAAAGIGVLLLISVPTLRRGAEQETSYFADLVEGVRYVAHHTFVRWLLLLFAIVFTLTVAPSFLTPLMAARTFGGEPWIGGDVGILTTLEIAFSVGMMLGGIVIAVWGGTKNKVIMIAVASVLFGALNLGLGFSTELWMFFGVMFLVGLAVPFFSTPSMTLLQEIVEPERHGRVFGFVGIVMALAMPLGMVIFGPLADNFSVESLLIAAGIVTFVVVGLALLMPTGRRALRDGGPKAPEPEDLPAGEAAPQAAPE